MWPILKIDARTQIEAAPDEQTEMRCRSANQSLITDVFALRPYFCTIQLQPIRTAMPVRCQITASVALDGGHQILRCEFVLGDCAALHHEPDVSHDAEVGDRIAGHGDDVRKLALFDRANVLF